MLEYLSHDPIKFAATLTAFRSDTDQNDVALTGSDLLEKKWISVSYHLSLHQYIFIVFMRWFFKKVVRLQKRILELESKLEAQAEELRAAVRGNPLGAAASGAAAGNDRDKCLPRGPAKCVLAGHRAPVTCVCVHPLFSLAASGSEDNTIKVWDYDTAGLARPSAHIYSIQHSLFIAYRRSVLMLQRTSKR
jgi:WD40 repeat protein